MKSVFAICAPIFIAFVAPAQVPNYVPTNGLQGYWPFSGNANDLTQNGYNGTVFGAQLTTDRIGNSNCAYSFNGTSNYISTNYTGILGTGPRSVSFWSKTSYTATDVACVSWGDNTAGTRFTCGINANPTGPLVSGSYCFIEYNSPSPIADNGWHHYVYLFNGGSIDQVKIYQDGIYLTQVATVAAPTTILNTVNNFNVHFAKLGNSSTASAFFNGQLDDIGIWDRVLTDCEIQQLFRSTLDLINVSATSTTICRGQSTILSASGGNSYLWDNAANTATTLVSPTTSTNYVVTGTIVGGCVSTKTIGVFVSICTDIKSKISVKPAITIFPNPAKVEITVTGIVPLSHLEIYTALGSQIYSGSSDTEEQKIDLQFLKAGIYFLQVSGNHQSIIKKFIVESQ